MDEKLFMPSYGKDFFCIADKCPENCCVEWIVDLDEKTRAFYEKAEGEVGDKIRSHMVFDEENEETVFTLEKGINHVKEWGILKNNEGKSFINTLDDSNEAGSDFANNENGNGFKPSCSSTDYNCPFQQDDGLCEIRLKYGYEHTSETCREHPEFNEEYEGFTERSFSLSCPEVARLISETRLKKDIDEDDEIILSPLVYPTVPCDSTDPVLNRLCRERNKFFYNFDEDRDLFFHIKALRTITFSMQDDLYKMDNGFEDVIPEREKMFLQKYINTKDFSLLLEDNIRLLDFMINNLDFLTERWKEALSFTHEALINGKINEKEFFVFALERNHDISRVFSYFVYRYFIKAVNDCDIIKWSEFIIKAAFVPVIVSFVTGMDFYRTAALFSREVEHDGDNAATLLEMIFES